MELKTRPGKYGDIPYYSDTEEELLQFEPGIRVLPAQYYYDKKLMFTYLKRHEPGTKMWPLGGHELKGPSGEFRAYFLDQVILHPSIFESRKRADKIRKRHDKEAISREKAINKRRVESGEVVKSKRGRKPLSEDEKLKRKIERELTPVIEGEKRKGRKPLSDAERVIREVEKLKKQEASGGKRGRKPMSEEKKAEKEREKEARRAKSGGKRGRPKSK